jgi:hypothetical protein
MTNTISRVHYNTNYLKIKCHLHNGKMGREPILTLGASSGRRESVLAPSAPPVKSRHFRQYSDQNDSRPGSAGDTMEVSLLLGQGEQRGEGKLRWLQVSKAAETREQSGEGSRAPSLGAETARGGSGRYKQKLYDDLSNFHTIASTPLKILHPIFELQVATMLCLLYE